MSVAQLRDAHTRGSGWVAIGWASEVPMLEGRSVRLGDRRIAVFRLQDGWAAVDHACPHRGGPLADGIVADRCVICPLHNHRFSLTTGERQDGAGERVQVYEVRERDGRLELNEDDLGPTSERA
jgi:nitrite reductase (NADH) small subunit